MVLLRYFFIQKVHFLKHFMTLIEKNFSFRLKKFRNGCLNCILRVYRSILVKHLISNISSFSDLQQKIINLSAKNVRQGFRNCIFRVHRISLGKNDFYWKKLLNFFFSDIERKIIEFFVEKISAWWSKLLYAFRKWSFEEKLFNQRNESFQVICDIERKNFGVWQKSFQQVCRNCILRVQRNRLRNFFFEKTIFLLFRVIGQKTFGLWQESLFCRIVKCAI